MKKALENLIFLSLILSGWLSLGSNSISATSNIQIATGWNLVGNGSTDPLQVATTFGSSPVTTIWKWNADSSTWSFYAPSMADGGAAYAATKGYKNLVTIKPGDGFWINASQPFELPALTAGVYDASNYQQGSAGQMLKGWNLISVGESMTPNQFNAALSSSSPVAGVISQNVTTLWAWDNLKSNWFFYAPSFEAQGNNALANYISGKGYLDFSKNNKMLGQGVGFWVNNPNAPTVTPLAVSAMSYNNKNNIDTDNVQLPSFRLLRDTHGWTFSETETSAGCNTPGCQGGVVNDRSLAFGDFFQDGTYSAFITTWRRTGVHDSYLKVKPIVDAPNKVYFAKYTNGKWVDKTSVLLPKEADRFTCVSHSYTAVSDFNKDGKPDLFVSCHGIDYSFGPGDTLSGQGIEQLLPTTWRNILFNNQIIYLSQPDGTYKRTEIADEIYGHHATAADVDGDGHADVATVNASWGNANPNDDYRPFFLMGRGDGTFTKNYSTMPTHLVKDVGSRIHIYWTYLIPTENGRVDLIAVGDKVAWYKNPGNGNFSHVIPTYLPLEVGYQGTPLDIIYKDGNFYVDHSGGDWPGVMRVKKVNAQSLAVTPLYSLDRDLGMSEGAISPQLKITKDKQFLVPFVAGCQRDIADPLFSTSKCSIKVPLN